MKNKLFWTTALCLAVVIVYQIWKLTAKSEQPSVAQKSQIEEAKTQTLKMDSKAVKIAEKISKTPEFEKAEAAPAKTEIAKPNVRVASASSPQVVKMKVTAYCLCGECCGQWSGGNRTSIGDKANIYDGVAADPKTLPYRTKLNIPGVGIKEVDDTGGGMRQSAKQGICHIDVRMSSHSEARKWGVRWLEVEVLGKFKTLGHSTVSSK